MAREGFICLLVYRRYMMMVMMMCVNRVCFSKSEGLCRRLFATLPPPLQMMIVMLSETRDRSITLGGRGGRGWLIMS